MKTTIMDTAYAKAAALSPQAKACAEFLIKHDSYVSLSEAHVKSLEQIRAMAPSHLANIYSKAVIAGSLNQIKYLDFTGVTSDIPEVLTIDDITIDGKYLSSTMPVGYQKAWINLTPILSARATRAGAFQITDVQRLNTLVTRALLTMSYNDSDGWLTPQLSSYIVEFYSMSLASMLRQMYQLDVNETRFVQVLFATFYAQKLSREGSPMNMPPLLSRCPFLGSERDVRMVLDEVEEVRTRLNAMELTIPLLAQIIAEAGPMKLRKLKARHLYTMYTSSATDSKVMAIAIEYPPYFVTQVLRVLAGAKNPVILNLMKFGETTKRMNAFAEQLTIAPSFLGVINR